MKLNKIEFLKEIDKYRQITIGSGREISERAGISYTKYQNYVKGAGANVEVMESIIEAIEGYAEEIKELITDLEG